MSDHKLLRIAAALAWFAASPALACDILAVPTSSTLRLEYDPFAFSPTTARLTFELENRGSSACSVDLVLLDAARVPLAQQDVGGTGVGVTFTLASSDATPTPTAVPGIWRVALAANQRSKMSIEGLVTQDAVATAGEHAADLTLEIRDAGAMTTSVPGLPARVVLAAMPRAQMNIVGAAATFGQGAPVAQVDFGMIVSNARRRVFLQVRANTRARLTIDSANAGRLVRPDSPEQERGIPYEARLVDEPIDLTKHWERVIEPPKTIAGTSLPLDLILGIVDGHVAGSYSDVLTVELSAI